MAQGGDIGLLGSAGLKCRGKPSEQGNEDGTHCENDDDLTNDLMSSIFNPDGVLGNDRRCGALTDTISRSNVMVDFPDAPRVARGSVDRVATSPNALHDSETANGP